jgi:diguanylate cyclase (GGDEF)-like protein/PAS domain S-box-containing protein
MAPSAAGDAEAIPERTGSGLALPLPGGHTIQGVLEFTFEELEAPSEPLLDRLEPIARLVGETLARIRAEHRAGGSGERLGGLLAGAGEGIVVTDPSGRIQSWNLAAARLLETEGGWEVPTGRSFASLLPESSRDRFKRALAVTAAEDQAGHAPSVELRLPPMGPGRPPLSLNLTAWQGDGGERCCVIALRAGPGQNSNGSQLVRSSSEPAASTEAALFLTGNIRWGGPSILHASQQFCRLTGYSEAELLGRSLRILSGPKTPDEPFTELRRRLAEGEPAWLEVTAYRKDGGEFLLRLDVSPVRNDRGQVTHFVATQGDVASDVAVTTPLLPTGRDPLTGLANRDLFNKMLRRAIERSRRKPEASFAVLFLDLDGFKDVNDSLGHVLGDQLLVSVARRLEEAVRPGDILVRFGGDEFVILLDHVGGIADVIAVADRVRDRLNRPFRIDGKEIRISASVGIATSETGYTSVDEVVRDADSAMYKAKEEGSGSYRIFDQSLRDEARREGKLRLELQASLDRGEFRLHYQPLMDLRSGRITGLEALLRWDHPERGLVAATEFIDHAEAMRLILPIGRWVIQESCRQLKGWMEQVSSDLPLVLSLNLSARELLDPRARDWFEESLAETGVSAEALRVEIPESFFSRPAAEVEAALRPIRDLGVRIGIDDFGKGTIPIGQLHRFPIDFLKLDRSFVADLHRGDGDNGRAVRAILAMAASLGLDVVAPGVETSLQEELLRELSCPTAQGYLFSAPVDAEKAGRLLASGRANSRN